MKTKDPIAIEDALANAVEHVTDVARGKREKVKIAISKETARDLVARVFMCLQYRNFSTTEDPFNLEGKQYRGCNFVVGYEKDIVVFLDEINHFEFEPIKINIYE